MILHVDPKLCGVGEGAQCCAFLAVMDGFVCGRTIPGMESQIRKRLAEGTMNAQYDPGELPFPECQEARNG